MLNILKKLKSDQERHDYILKTLVLNKPLQQETHKQKRDINVIKEHHRFLWDDDSEADVPETWETRLARRYYDKLFKEYCIADLTRHKENKVALRWRTEAEVVTGKGQFICGSRICNEPEQLRTWEVNFAYLELGEKKNALIKLRLCPEHSLELNYTSRKREVKRLKHFERSKEKESRRQSRKKVAEEKLDGTTKLRKTAKISDEGAAVEMDNQITNDAEEVSSGSKPEKTEEIWNKQPEVEAEVCMRENDFERYLEDLLL